MKKIALIIFIFIVSFSAYSQDTIKSFDFIFNNSIDKGRVFKNDFSGNTFSLLINFPSKKRFSLSLGFNSSFSYYNYNKTEVTTSFWGDTTIEKNFYKENYQSTMIEVSYLFNKSKINSKLFIKGKLGTMMTFYYSEFEERKITSNYYGNEIQYHKYSNLAFPIPLLITTASVEVKYFLTNHLGLIFKPMIVLDLIPSRSDIFFLGIGICYH